jgi:hypothetical protein
MLSNYQPNCNTFTKNLRMFFVGGYRSALVSIAGDFKVIQYSDCSVEKTAYHPDRKKLALSKAEGWRNLFKTARQRPVRSAAHCVRLDLPWLGLRLA